MTLPSIPGVDVEIQAGAAGWYTAHVRDCTDPDSLQWVPGAWYQVGSLETLDDEDGTWVNNIDVNQAWQKYGLGTALIAAAIADNGTIYFSDYYEDPENDSSDTRHCSTEAAALANSCIRKGMKVEWRTPRWATGGSDDEGYDNY